VDFICLEQRLIVEADGSQHAESVRDAVRDGWLATQGFRILRFWNADILARRSQVAETVWAALATPHPAAARPPSPARGEGQGASPSPLAEGEREKRP
jgi:very-short-patch-repair endonuclease